MPMLIILANFKNAIKLSYNSPNHRGMVELKLKFQLLKYNFSLIFYSFTRELNKVGPKMRFLEPGFTSTSENLKYLIL